MRNIPNILSIFRLVLSVPFFLALYHKDSLMVYSLGGFAVVTDLLDGYLARRNNWISEFGKIIDPLSDKIFVGGTVLVLWLNQSLPFWFVCVVIGRDVMILVASILFRNKLKYVLPSNYLGKAAVMSAIITFVVSYFDSSSFISTLCQYICSFLLISSFINYSIRYIQRFET